MKIAFLYGKEPSSSLTKFWTGSRAYHVCFVDENTGKFWDMNLIRRRGLFREHYGNREVRFADCPVPVSVEFLEHKLETDDANYGVLDYLLFALRPIYHLFGRSTRNMAGTICSEMLYNDLVECGWSVRFAEVPSPADLEKALLP